MIRTTDHKNLNLSQLNRNVLYGKANNKIIWQPRILCWYADRTFNGKELEEPYRGMTLPELYRDLGCSNRIYEYGSCYKKVWDPRIHQTEKNLSPLEKEITIETPVGKVSAINKKNTSNEGIFPSKWWITCEEDMKVMMWIEEHTTWEWDQERFDKIYREWGDLGAPTMCMPRTNVLNLYNDTMGVEAGIFALMDYPSLVNKYFTAMDENHHRLIDVINKTPIDVINFGDNLHCGTLPPYYFEEYVLPAYLKRNDHLHQAGKFTCSHWDGDTKALLPYARECGLDGIEAITPKPQGDVTLEEMKDALRDDVFLLDGIAAILFDDIFPESALIEQTEKLIEYFAPNLVLGISDEMSSTGNIERVRLVGKIVDDYNAKISQEGL